MSQTSVAYIIVPFHTMNSKICICGRILLLNLTGLNSRQVWGLVSSDLTWLQSLRQTSTPNTKFLPSQIVTSPVNQTTPTESMSSKTARVKSKPVHLIPSPWQPVFSQHYEIHVIIFKIVLFCNLLWWLYKRMVTKIPNHQPIQPWNCRTPTKRKKIKK